MDSRLQYLTLITVVIVTIFLLARGGEKAPDDNPEDPQLSFMEFLPQMET